MTKGKFICPLCEKIIETNDKNFEWLPSEQYRERIYRKGLLRVVKETPDGRMIIHLHCMVKR